MTQNGSPSLSLFFSPGIHPSAHDSIYALGAARRGVHIERQLGTRRHNYHGGPAGIKKKAKKEEEAQLECRKSANGLLRMHYMGKLPS